MGSVLLRFLLGVSYPRTINCYPDEWLYLSGAESLWNHHQVMVYNVPSTFAKVGYPWLIAPAFAIADIKLRGAVIALINSVTVSLGIFPIYGLAKRLLSRERHITFCLLLYVISPTMTYSMTYMSEVLYLPVALCLVYLFYRVLTEKNHKKRVLLGVLMLPALFLAYVTKSQALAFPVAMVLTLLVLGISAGGMKRWGSVAILFAGIAASLILVKKGFFGIDFESIVGHSDYVIFGIMFFLVITVLAFCVLPLMIPGMTLKSLSEDARRLYIFLTSLIVVTAGVVAVMIYIVEDYPSLTPRAHVR